MKKMFRFFSVVLFLTLTIVLCCPYLSAGATGAESGSGVIEIPAEGIRLEYSVLGGNITLATNDGWQSQYFIEGTVRPGETLSIAISGNGTTLHKTNPANDDLEATMSVWFETGNGQENSETVTLAPGESGSLATSLIVPGDVQSVEIHAIISNAWMNPNGGGSRSLILRAEFDVVTPEENTTTPTEPNTNNQGISNITTTSDTYNQDLALVRFADIYGEVTVRPNGEDQDADVFASLDTPLHHNDRITTKPRSGAILSFSDLSSFVIKEDTAIVLDIANERETKISLILGNIWVNLNKMVENGSMEVEMSQAVAGIKGTTMICESDGQTSTLKVIEGTVEFTPKMGNKVLVTGGQMIMATDAGIGQIEAFDINAEMASWDENTQELTAQILTETKDDFPIAIIVAAILFLIAGLVFIIAMRSRSRNKKSKKSAAQSTPVARQKSTQAAPTIHSKGTARFCNGCGNPIETGVNFCPKCGKKIN